MVVIRLARTGAKKTPFYHIVVTDSRNSRDGRFIERLGYFNPMARGAETRLELNQERLDYWQGCGAKASDRVSSLVKKVKKGIDLNAPAPKRADTKKAQSESALASQKEKVKAELAEAAKTDSEEAAAE